MNDADARVKKLVEDLCKTVGHNSNGTFCDRCDKFTLELGLKEYLEKHFVGRKRDESFDIALHSMISSHLENFVYQGKLDSFKIAVNEGEAFIMMYVVPMKSYAMKLKY